MPPATRKLAVKDNKQFCDTLIMMSRELETYYISFGGHLKECFDLRRYDGVMSKEELLMELRLSHAKASKLVSVSEKFGHISHAELAKAGGWSALAEVLTVVKSKSDAKKWLKVVQAHPRHNVRKFVEEEKTGVDMAKCKHEDTYSVTFCRVCKDSWREK